MKSLITAILFFSLTLFAAKLNSTAPTFTLPSHDGKQVSLSDFKGKHVVLEWLNHDCPYVVKHYSSGNMQDLQNKYTAKEVVWLSIISSAKGKQGYLTAEEARKITKEKNANPSHILFDTDGKVGKAYGAKTTPHMYLISPEGNLVYKGAIDDKPTTDIKDVKGATNYISQAIDASMSGKKIATADTRAYGCSVKY